MPVKVSGLSVGCRVALGVETDADPIRQWELAGSETVGRASAALLTPFAVKPGWRAASTKPSAVEPF